MSRSSSRRLAQRFHDAYRQLARGAQRRDRAMCGLQGLSPTQWHTLSELWEFGQLSMNELADRLRITRSTLTRIVDLLEKKNLAKRRAAKEDRRRILVTLTPAGEELYHGLDWEVVQSQRQILGQLRREDQESAVRQLEALARAMSGWCDRNLQGLAEAKD